MKTLTAIITVLIAIAFTSVNNPVNAQISNRDKAKTMISNYEFAKAIALTNS